MPGPGDAAALLSEKEDQQRLRHAGRELFLSVQPNATPAHRKAFLAELPKLMQQLTLSLPVMPASTEAPEPTEGRALAEHVQVGFAYQMNLQGQWHKVRLAHVSTARSFFIFTRGSRHKQTISLTQRMLARLCESGRLRAFESALLIERASARARRQLAALGGVQAGAA